MNTAWRPSLLAGSLCALAALLVGCSPGTGKGYGSAGGQSSYEPQAVITPIGHVAGPDGVLFVRSGAEVVLSAKDSTGVDSAILGVTWSPANTAAQAVRMYERGATAMSFRAPQPADDTPLELRFNLTVRASDGETASSEITIKVNRVPDPNDFLLSDVSTSADAVNLVLVASSYTGLGNFTTALGRDADFTISVQKQVRYKRAITTAPNPSTTAAANDPLYCPSTDAAITCVKIGQPLQLTGAWKQTTGVSGTAFTLFGQTIELTRNGNLGLPYQNPRFRLRPPTLNADEVNFAVLTNGIPNNLNATGVPPSDTRRNNLLYTADIDTAEAEYAITMTSTDLGGTGRRADLLVFAADASTPTTLTFLAEGLAPTNADPGVATVTGTQALNGIKAAPGVVESRTTALAYYAAIDPADQRTTLDDWLNDNCMQRSLAGPPGYYGSDIHSTYLNDRDLGFGREMYFKTECTTAQRNATNATINTTGGERASIVFNYSSLEGAIKRSGSFLAVAMEYRADASGGPKYTRFYTFAPDPRSRVWKRVTSANFDGRRERYTPGNCTVCHGGKPKATYPGTPGGGDLGGTFIPWDANALLFADTDKSILDDRLKPGFTRDEQLPYIQALNVQGVKPIVNSRVIETQATGDVLTRWNATLDLLDKWYSDLAKYGYVPSTWQNGVSSGTSAFTSNKIYSEVIAENCRMCHMQRITEPGGSGLTLASAPQFSSFTEVDGVSDPTGIETSRLKQKIFEQHLMPASRLTSDRFWVPAPGATTTSAQVLADHVRLTLPAALPGVKADAVLANPQQAQLDPNAVTDLSVRLASFNSRFASSYDWTLTRPLASQAVLVGNKTAEPALLADVSGTYTLNLTVRDSAGQQDAIDQPLSFVVNRKPVGGSYAADYNSSSTPVQVDLINTGGAKLGDGSNQIAIVSALAGLNASITGSTLTFTPVVSGTIQYRITDADGDATCSPSLSTCTADKPKDGTVQVRVILPTQWNLATVGLTCGSAQNYCQSLTGTGIDPRALAAAKLGLTVTDFNNNGYTVSVSFPQQPFRTSKTTAQSNASAPQSTGGVGWSSTSISYFAPPAFVSYQTSSLSPTTLDSFTYRITINQGGGPVLTSTESTVNVTVDARQRWSSVLSILQTNTCKNAGCHNTGSDGTTRAWGSLADGMGNPTSGDSTYTELLGTNCPLGEPENLDGNANNNVYCLNLTSPASSMLYRKPQGLNSHSGGALLSLPNTQLNTILDWIRDGAYKN